MRLLGDRTMNNELDRMILEVDVGFSDIEIKSTYPSEYNYAENEINSINVAVLNFKATLLAYLADRTNKNKELMLKDSWLVSGVPKLRNQFFKVMSDIYLTEKDFNYLKLMHSISWTHHPVYEVSNQQDIFMRNYYLLQFQIIQLQQDAHRLHGQVSFEESSVVCSIAEILAEGADEYANSLRLGAVDTACLSVARDKVKSKLKSSHVDLGDSIIKKILAVIKFIASLLPVSLNNTLLHKFTSLSKASSFNSIESVIGSAYMDDESDECKHLLRMRL